MVPFFSPTFRDVFFEQCFDFFPDRHLIGTFAGLQIFQIVTPHFSLHPDGILVPASRFHLGKRIDDSLTIKSSFTGFRIDLIEHFDAVALERKFSQSGFVRMNGRDVAPIVGPSKWPARVKNVVGGRGLLGRLLLKYKAIRGGEFKAGFHGGQQQCQSEAECKQH